MATIKYQILSKSENAPIYLRLSIKRGLSPRTKTGLHINPKDCDNLYDDISKRNYTNCTLGTLIFLMQQSNVI